MKKLILFLFFSVYSLAGFSPASVCNGAFEHNYKNLTIYKGNPGYWVNWIIGSGGSTRDLQTFPATAYSITATTVRTGMYYETRDVTYTIHGQYYSSSQKIALVT